MQPPYLRTVTAIARVEPLTTARALRGPFDYRIPRRDAGRRRRLGAGRAVRAAADAGPGGGHGDRERGAARAAGGAGRDARVGRAGRAGRLGLWVAEHYCSTPARGLALVLPPGTGTGAARRAGRAHPGAARRRAAPPAGREALAGADGRRLGPRQHAALERSTDGPMTATGLRQSAGAGHGTLARLAELGSDRARAQALRAAGPAVERGAGARAPAPPGRPHAHGRPGGRARRCSSGRCARAATRRAAAARRDGQRQDGGLPAGGRGRARAGPLGDRDGARRSRSRRRRRGASSERFGDRVAVLHSKLGLGERYDEWQRLRRGEARAVRRPALGGVRAAPRPRPDRRRRGARLRLQAGERPALRRAPGRRAPRAAGRRGAAVRQRDAAPRELAAHAAAVAARARGRPSRCRRSSCSTCAGCATRCIPDARARSRRSTRRGGEGDRARQPARLVAVRRLPRLRPGAGCARAAT